MNALSELRPLTYDGFTRDHLIVAAAERNSQIAIQAALDVSSIVLAYQQALLPKRYSDLFPALAEIDVLPADFAQRLVPMAKFRNVLVHLYLEVDRKRVHRYLQENLDDFEIFARHVSEWLHTHAAEE